MGYSAGHWKRYDISEVHTYYESSFITFTKYVLKEEVSGFVLSKCISMEISYAFDSLFCQQNSRIPTLKLTFSHCLDFIWINP